MHSLRQMSVKDEIEGIARRRMTGIVSGPGVTLRGDGTAVIWCKVDRPGRIIVQVGRSEEDQSDDFTAFADVQQGKEGDPCVGIVRVEKLQSDTKYYLKVGLETDDNAFRGIEGGDVIKSSFKTLLDSDERGEVVVNVGSLGTKGFGGKVKQLQEETPDSHLLLLGNVVPPKEIMGIGESGEGEKVRTPPPSLDPLPSLTLPSPHHHHHHHSPQGHAEAPARQHEQGLD